MTTYINSLGFRVRETSKYRTTFLLETETNVIKFVEDLEDLGRYRVSVIELGNMEKEPITVNFYGVDALNIYKAFRATKTIKEVTI